MDFCNFDSFFDMTKKGQIKSLEPIIFGFQGHYMAVFGHVKNFKPALFIWNQLYMPKNDQIFTVFGV